MKHLAIIMDGNRRWAKSKGLPVVMGHKSGADNIEKVAELAKKMGIRYLTLWGLSTENLIKREKQEVSDLIKIIDNAPKYLKKLLQNGVRLELIGDLEKLPEKSQKVLSDLVEDTKENNDLVLVLALVYGGKDEIIRGIKKFVREGGDIEKLDTENFGKLLDTGKYPPADIIVRTGGDIRHSGFLLYQSDYSEYYFTETKWPDFGKQDLEKVFEQFNLAKRNFGK